MSIDIRESLYRDKPTYENFAKGALFAAGIFGLFWFGDFMAKGFDVAPVFGNAGMDWLAKWLILLSVGFCVNFFLMGIAILVHEAAHGLFCKNKTANEIAGILFGFYIFQPFYSYRHAHFVHHNILRDRELDPEAGFHLERSTWERLIIGALRNSSLLTRNALKQLRNPKATKKQRRESWMDLSARLLATCFWATVIILMDWSVWYTVVPFLLMSGFVYSLRGTLDHHGLPATELRNGKRNLAHEKLAYIVHTNPLVEFVWSNVNYHAVHHMYPTVPARALRAAYEQTNQEIKYTETNGYFLSMCRLLPKPYYSNETL